MTTEISALTVIRQHPRTAARSVGEHALVIVIDKNTLHTLNEVGTWIWNYVAEPRSVTQIVAGLVVEFEVDESKATEDVHAFAQELMQLGVLQEVPS